jgi:hypothetical protein
MSAPKRPLSPSLSSSLAESSRLRPLPPAKSKSKGSRQSSGFKRAGQTSTPTPTILKTRIRHLDQGSKGVSGRITTSSYPVEVSPLSFGVLPDDGDSVWIDEAYTNVAGEMASEPSMKKTSKATKAQRKAQYKVYLLNTYLNIMLTIDDSTPWTASLNIHGCSVLTNSSDTKVAVTTTAISARTALLPSLLCTGAQHASSHPRSVGHALFKCTCTDRSARSRCI